MWVHLIEKRSTSVHKLLGLILTTLTTFSQALLLLRSVGVGTVEESKIQPNQHEEIIFPVIPA